MRVLLTTDTVGGVWTFSMELTKGLLDRGHAVALVSFGRAPSPAQQRDVLQLSQTYGSVFLYESSELPLEWMEANHAAYAGAETLLLRILDRFDADLVHSSQFCFGALPTSIPRLLTAHSDVLSWAAACRPGGLEPSGWLDRYRGLVSAGLQRADRIVAPTRWMLKELMTHFPIPVSTQVISNGRTLPLPAGDTPRHLQAITVGRLWDEAKGLALLNDLPPCMPILVAGENSFGSVQAPALKAVTLLGSLDEGALLQSFRSSSLYLATSLYEPFGLAPLEAALCGCGLLVRDIPSLREVWGIAAEYFTDAHSLTTLLSRLSHSPHELEALRERSLKRALELSADRMVTNYLAVYQELQTAAQELQTAACTPQDMALHAS